MAKRYLVTGGTGFIGSALVRRLVNEGHRVRILDDDSRGRRHRLADLADDIELVGGDIRNADVVRDAVDGMDRVVHLAAVNGTEFFYTRPELVLDVAVRGMLNIVDACRVHDVGELVVASSSEVYQTPPSLPTDESAPLSIPDVRNPRYSYAGGKILSELVAFNYGRTGFDRMIVFRPHNVYGPDMGWEHVLPQLSLKAAEAVAQSPAGKVLLQIQGDGTQSRSFIHIDDFTSGLMTVIEKGAHLDIYHIGTMDEVSIAEIAQKVVHCFKREAELIFSELPTGGTQRRCPDIAKLRGLGFEPRLSLDDGLPSLVEWYVANADRRP
jgi:dTDP-glucose 4,6-dehydratase/UDP-glucose 4-epimerase